MSDQDAICKLCGFKYGQHSSEERCPAAEFYIDTPKHPVRFHPSNRFTPKTHLKDICAQCHYPASQHTGDRRACPTDGMSTFTPYPTGKEALQAGSVSGDGEARVVAQTDCPAGCAPFDLPKALAGARLVTRDGKPATSLRSRGGYLLATIDGEELPFALDGTVACLKGPQPNDLFLAAKEERCSRCGGSNLVCDGDGEDMVPCPECSHAMSPPPETEARRAESQPVECLGCHTLPNQIESKSAGMFWLTCVQCKEETASRETLAEAIAEWNAINGIRPAPAPPRRVWIAVYPTGAMSRPAKSQIECDDRDEVRTGVATEFIELNDAMRAKLGLGGEKV